MENEKRIHLGELDFPLYLSLLLSFLWMVEENVKKLKSFCGEKLIDV
jgi:hypothetical protein